MIYPDEGAKYLSEFRRQGIVHSPTDTTCRHTQGRYTKKKRTERTQQLTMPTCPPSTREIWAGGIVSACWQLANVMQRGETEQRMAWSFFFHNKSCFIIIYCTFQYDGCDIDMHRRIQEMTNKSNHTAIQSQSPLRRVALKSDVMGFDYERLQGLVSPTPLTPS